MRAWLEAYSFFSKPVCAWKAARYRKGRKTARRVPLPVVSVGNLALGGTGKTPLVCELIGHFLGRGYHPALVTRGYRGSWEKTGGVLSDGRSLFGGAREAGDEPALIARRFPDAGVFVGRDRILSCLKAEALGFDLCILDDAFQHLRLARDLDIVLHHPSAGLPLREGEGALSRADILLLNRDAGAGAADGFRSRFPRLSVFEYGVAPRGLFRDGEGPPAPLSVLKGKRILAVAGIARPGRFFDMLEKAGAAELIPRVFPDHYAYPPAGMSRIAALAARREPDMILVTEKDAVKIGLSSRPFGDIPLLVLRLGIDLPSAFFEAVETAVSAGKAGRG